MGEQHNMSRIIILGATGALGKYVVEQAVSANHEVSVIVRTPSKLPTHLRDRLTIHQADIAMLSTSQIATLIRGHDALINTAGRVSEGQPFVTLVDHIVTGIETLPETERPVCWFLAGAGVLDIGDSHRMGVDLPFIKETYWPHRENYNRLQSSSLDWRLLCPGPLVEETPVGIDNLRIAIDRLPVSIPTVSKEMPDSLLVQLFASRVPEMTIPYADAAAFMLNNLQPANALSQHRIGLVQSTILARDDDRIMAQEGRPALREAVNRELPEGLSGTIIRPAVIRAKRYQGIDYDNIPVSLVDAVIEPGDTQYARVKSTYMRGGSPGIIFQVTDTDQIVDALAFARLHADVPLGIRSGGHGISGRSTNHGGIIIDLSRLNKIEVLDEATRRVRIEPGALWGNVAAALAPYGWALSSGDYGGVGVGGLATSGGIGWLAREHGLTIDRLRAVDMILADGTLVHASDEENKDLFWAVRGAGANFGIVTSFEFEVNEIGEVGWAQLAFDASDTADFLERWGATVESSPRDLTSFLIMGPPRRGQPTIAQMMAVVDSDQPDVIINRLEPIASIAPLYDQQVVITSYANIMANAQGGDHNGQGEPEGRSGLIEHITPEFAQAIERLLSSGDVYFFQIRSVGGSVSDIPSEATAYGYRLANFSVAAAGTNRERMNRHWDKLAEYFEGMYLSFDTDLRPERLNDAFPPATLERLRTLKQQYDPENVFRDNFNIAPSAVVS